MPKDLGLHHDTSQDAAQKGEAFERSRALAAQAVDLLLTHRIAPIPPHYAVSYAYWSGEVTEIGKTLDARLQAGRPLEEALIRQLYEQYVLPDPFNQYRGMRTGLQHLLQAILHAIRTADSGASEFTQALEKNIEKLGTARDPEALEAIAGDLLSAASEANRRNRSLQQELQSAHLEVERLRDELEHHRRAAMIDPLTGLFNRRALEQLLAELLATDHDAPLAMLLLDIDHFKRINDSYGHAVGDIVIRHVVDTLRKCIRREDIAVRYGGEEFIILLPRTPLEGALKVAESIRTRVAGLRLVRRQDNYALDPFTLSIGVALRRPDDTQETLFQRADRALYRSKSEGRNRVTHDGQPA